MNKNYPEYCKHCGGKLVKETSMKHYYDIYSGKRASEEILFCENRLDPGGHDSYPCDSTGKVKDEDL